MGAGFWEQVVAEGHPVPPDRPLTDLTIELTAMLGDTDPAVRDEIAYTTLSAWLAEGVYDDLLEGFGDGMAAGLVVGLGTASTDTVFRRSYSALVLTGCLERDNAAHLVPADTVLRWGDRLMGWLVRERDLRGFVPGKGSAAAVGAGADALRALAGSRHLGRLELTVLLDVVADRLAERTSFRLTGDESDRLAAAVLAVLRRDRLPMDVLDPWASRLTAGALPVGAPDQDQYVVAANVQAFLRALHLQLALAPNPPACRADLLLTLIAGLRRTNPLLA